MQKEQQQLAALIKGKKVAFIGAGVSHKALIKEFVELGAHVTLCDQKKSVDDFGDYAATIRELGVDLSLGENYLEGFKGQDIIMRTPGFVGYFEKPLQDAMAAGTMVTSEVELFFDFCPCEIVGVTGSDGKTTTTTLISKFYEAAGRKVHLGGNIGAALLPMLPEVAPEDVAVVELSSFQLISMHKSPKIAVVTNVTPNHLDHHKDMQEYIDAKRNILIHQVPPCREVLGYENEITRGMQADCKGKQVWFTRLHETDNGAFLRDDGILKVSRSVKENQYRIGRKREELEKALGREPTLGELAESVQMLPEELAMTMDAANDVESIYQIIYQGEGNELRLLDKIPEKENLHDRLLNKIFLEELLRSLNAEERKLLYMRYFREMTQTEVADEFGVSQVQISRMEKKILNRLRAII